MKKVGRITEVVPFTVDRVVMWCANEEELRSVLEKGDLFRGREFIAKIKNCDTYSLSELTQIEVSHSWIGVQGLSLNLWNLETFVKIGEGCGGLIEVAPEPLDMSFLIFVKLEVKGFLNSFLNSTAEFQSDNETIQVRLFSLRSVSLKEKNQWEEGRSLGWVTRIVRAKP